MKQKLLRSFKNLHEKTISMNDVIMTSMYLLAITFSLRSGGILIRELVVCGLIIGLALLHKKTSI
ncbi:hypothetical protein [Cognatitamlana onchidii]|uniref:hypothetical protein n=1 Tax=Cognatitamlana onchidii TaxID=2562860 RepID=UPI0010A657FE|nr:hypothetical protein [Algibacter onchidii]